MKPLNRNLKFPLAALAACLAYFLGGCSLIPLLGVQNDEALFANGVFKPFLVVYKYPWGHNGLPVMLMSYLGTLKSWLYRPIFQWFGANVVALRLPMVLAGGASVWLFFVLLRRVAGLRAALIGCGLLATDSLYLTTTCFDWGPVALQHLLLLSGMLLLFEFYQHGRLVPLACGAFLLGLEMWDKALAIWMLSGIGVALILVFPRQIVRVTRLMPVFILVLFFALGALPLILYNVEYPMATFHGNASWDTSDLKGKAHVLVATGDGSALFSWLTNEDWQTKNPRVPESLVDRASAQISALAGHPRHSLFPYLFVLALLLTPLARGPALRAIQFALVAMAIAWAQMAITANAGGSVHHSILVWPLPQMVVAIALAAASRRLGSAGVPVLAAVVAVVMVSGILVTNEYRMLMVRNGGSSNWTDAIFRLASTMKGNSASRVVCMDWGIFDNLRMLTRGRLPLGIGTDPIAKKTLVKDDRELLDRLVSEPNSVFINHTKDFEFFEGVNGKLVEYARNAGYRREVVATIPDSYQRPVYEVYRFVRE